MEQYIFIPSLKRLKEEILTTKNNLYKALIEEADRCFIIPLSETPPCKSTTYLSQALMNLTLAYKLSEDKKYLKETMRFINTIISYPYWGNAHLVNVDLSASWILFGLSLSYHYLEEDLSSQDKKRIEDKILLQAKIMFDYINDHEDSWPKHYFQNHNWINFTGLSMVGYVLKDKYRECEKYIQVAKENFEIVFSCMPEDGSDYEGVTYWRYGVLWLIVYATLLKDREDIDYFKKSKFLKNTFSYRLYQSASKLNMQLNFGDCHDKYSCNSLAIYYKLADAYNNGYAQKLANEIFNKYIYEEQQLSKIKPGILPEMWMALLFYNDKIKEKDFVELKKIKYFKDLGLISMRTGFSENSLVFSIKCSYPGGKKQWIKGSDYYEKHNKMILSLSHHHPDNLSYILTKNNEYLAIDDGYNRNIMPVDHNVLLVDDKYCDCENTNDVYLMSAKKRLEDNPLYDLKKYYGKINYFFTNQKITFFKMSNTNIYPLDLKMKEVSRFVISNDMKYILFIDKFESDEEHYYQSVINVEHPLKEVGNFIYELSMFDKSEYRVVSFDDLDRKEINANVKSVMTTQEPDNYARINFYHNIVSTKEKRKKHMRLEFFSEDTSLLELKDNMIKINESEYLLFENTFGFNFKGDYLYLKLKGNYVKELYLINGTYLKYKNHELIKLNRRKTVFKGGLNALLKR